MDWLKRYRFLVAVFITAAFLLASLTYYLFFLDTWFDETDHGYKAWLTASGLAHPFQDFAMKYGPVGFYSQVLWQWLFGPSVLASRLLSILFLLGMIVLVFDFLRRRGGKWLGLVGAALMIFHPFIIGKFIAGTPYSLVGFLMVLSLWLWAVERWSLGRRIILSSVAMAAAVLVRYNLLPVLVLWWLFIWLKTGRFRNLLWALTASLAMIVLLWLPYAILDWEYAVSVVFVMFGPLASYLPWSFFHLPGGIGAAFGSFWESVFNENRFKLIINVFTTYYPLLVIYLVGMISLVYAKWGEARIRWREQAENIFLIVAVAVIFITHFLLGPLQHKIYSLYFVPFLILAAGLSLGALSRRVHGPTSAAFLVSLLILMPISVALSGNDIIFFNRWDYADSDLARIKRGGTYLATLSQPADLILTLDNPDHVFLAGRLMVPERINRHDTYVNSTDGALLKRYARYNTEQFLHWLTAEADLFVFQREALAARLEPIAGTHPDLTGEVEQILRERYSLIGELAGVYPRKEERGTGTMVVYRRRSA